MPEEIITKTGEGELVRLKYSFKYGDKFDEPNDDWLKCIEATSDELLGLYSKTEDNALSAAFGSQKKKRLNRVFDAISFMYPDYRYPSKGQKRKSATSEKGDASAAPSEPAPKRKKVKVLTHRPRFIEPATVPEFGGETSSATEAKEPAVTQKTEKPAAMPKASPAKSGEPKAINIEEAEVEKTKILEVISPSAEVTVPKAQKNLTTTPKRKRMVNVLDVLEKIKTSSSTLGKTAEASKTRIETKQLKPKLHKVMPRPKLGLQSPPRRNPWKSEKKQKKNLQNKFYLKKLPFLFPKHLPRLSIILYDMLREKCYLQKKSEKLNIMPRD
jgi:hypothetical protein